MSQRSRAHLSQVCDQTPSQLFGLKIFNPTLMESDSVFYIVLRDAAIAGSGIGTKTRVEYSTTDTSCI